MREIIKSAEAFLPRRFYSEGYKVLLIAHRITSSIGHTIIECGQEWLANRRGTRAFQVRGPKEGRRRRCA